MNQLKCLFAYPALQDENIDIREFNEFTPRKIPSYHRFEQSKRGKNLVSFRCVWSLCKPPLHTCKEVKLTVGQQLPPKQPLTNTLISKNPPLKDQKLRLHSYSKS